MRRQLSRLRSPCNERVSWAQSHPNVPRRDPTRSKTSLFETWGGLLRLKLGCHRRALEFSVGGVAQCPWVTFVMRLGSGQLSRWERAVRAQGQPGPFRRSFGSACVLPVVILALILGYSLFSAPLGAQTLAGTRLRVPTEEPEQQPPPPDPMMQRLMRLRAEHQAQFPPQLARPFPAQPAQVPTPRSSPQVPTPQPKPQALPPVAVPEPMKVDYSHGLLSVNAERVPLSQVLQAISQRTGLQVRGLQEAGQPVSVHFSDAPVSQGVQNLLAGANYNYAVFGDLASAQDVRRARVVLFSATSGADIDTGDERRSSQSAVSDAQRSIWRAQLMSKNPAEQDAGFREISRLGPKEAFDALKDVIDNGDGVARLRALQLMDQDSQIDRAAVNAQLGAALDDRDTVLRDYSIQALGREASPESLNLLHQQLDTGDPNVRLNVVQAVSQRPDARPLLQQAASDPDPSVSALANELLRAGDAASPDPQSPEPESLQPEPQDPDPPVH